MRKLITAIGVLIITAMAMSAAYAGPATGDCCRWPTNPNGPCILDQLPWQPN